MIERIENENQSRAERLFYFTENCAGATEGDVRDMKIRVIHEFYDKENDLELRKTEEEYEVTEERGRYLVDFRVAKEITDPEGGDPESPVEA